MTAVLDHVAGKTFHGRKGGVENAFTYGIDMVLLDPAAPGPLPGLFSRNAGNLTALYDADHGGAPGRGAGVAWARAVLAAHGLPLCGPILLLAQPRVLGHVFNPVSFWLCYDAGDLPDDLHPNPAGYARIGERFASLVFAKDGLLRSTRAT